MTTKLTRTLCLTALVAACSMAFCSQATAQYPVAVTTIQPAVVGYQLEPRGIFGLRSQWRPVVAPVVTTVPAPLPTVKVTTPIYTSLTPVTTYYAPATTVAPLTTVAPVTTYQVRYKVERRLRLGK